MMPLPVALITGSNRGLGKAFALTFAKKGYAVALHYNKEAEKAKETAGLIKKQNGSCEIFKADIRSSKEANAMVESVFKKWKRIDVLINNAGLTRDKRLAQMSDEEWQDVLDTNLTGAFYCTRAVLAPMMSAKTGSIVNMVSYLSARPTLGAANYAAAKAGLASLTKSTALEGGSFNIRANAIMPGFHVTDMNRAVWERFGEQIKKQHLLSEMAGKEELAEFVFTLANLKTVTGQIFAFESRLI